MVHQYHRDNLASTILVQSRLTGRTFPPREWEQQSSKRRRIPFMQTCTPPRVYDVHADRPLESCLECQHSDLRAMKQGEFFTSLFTSAFNFF